MDLVATRYLRLWKGKPIAEGTPVVPDNAVQQQRLLGLNFVRPAPSPEKQKRRGRPPKSQNYQTRVMEAAKPTDEQPVEETPAEVRPVSTKSALGKAKIDDADSG